MDTSTQLTTESAFSLQNFEHAQRVAVMMAKSTLIPEAYRGKVENVMIAMEMSHRMNISPLMVMQNLYIVKGNPGWSGAFVIGLINGSKRFSTELKFEVSGQNDEYGYRAYALDQDGNKIEGTKVDWKMVKGEGWLDKPGSKWKTMPEQMFKYRSAAFFGRTYCPDLLMGMQTAEEIIDVQHTDVTVTSDEQRAKKEHDRIVALINNASTIEELSSLEPHVKEPQLDLFEDKKQKLSAK